MYTLSLLSYLLLTLSSSARYLLPRKSTSPIAYNPYIVCNGVSPSHAEGLPITYSEQTYRNRLDLCSAAHGARYNVACFCSTPNGRVHCDRNIADPPLWNTQCMSTYEDIVHHYELMGFRDGLVPLPQLCEIICHCTAT